MMKDLLSFDSTFDVTEYLTKIEKFKEMIKIIIFSLPVLI